MSALSRRRVSGRPSRIVYGLAAVLRAGVFRRFLRPEIFFLALISSCFASFCSFLVVVLTSRTSFKVLPIVSPHDRAPTYVQVTYDAGAIGTNKVSLSNLPTAASIFATKSTFWCSTGRR